MARHSFKKRGAVKTRTAGLQEHGTQPLHDDNAHPLGTHPRVKMTEPGQDAEASDYPSKPSRKGRRQGERTAAGGSGSAGVVSVGKGRAGV
jgi:hypothetical protein